MTRVLRTDYQAVNAAGVTLRTFDRQDAARAWVKDNAMLHDGLYLEEVTIMARRVYRPRATPTRRDFDFSIPAYGAAV
ncbi:MAG: hypothetical protein ACK4FB_07940 [Brevundimonas sp.]|uniref:hypothetical protein n=1 Tax=Brevundimonas sp. TaxID=1871086 RepID=UPI00391AA8F8